MGPFYYFCIFYSLSSKKFLFWLFKYQGLVDFWSAPLSWEIILACHVPLDNSGAVFRYSIFTEYISIMFASFKSSCPYFIILIVKSFFFFFKNDLYSLALLAAGLFSINLGPSNSKYFLF